MSQSFQALGVSTPVVEPYSPPAASPNLLQSRTSSFPTPSPGSTSSPSRRPGSGKTLAFGLPLSSAPPRRTCGRAALVLVPTRELAIQVASDLRPLAAAKGFASRPSTAAPRSGAGQAAKDAHILVATPGRLQT